MPSEQPKSVEPPKSRRWQPIIVAVAIIALVAGGTAYRFKPWEPKVEVASIDRMAFPLPDKPSIAVLPFDNYSDDPKLDYFADGLTEDLTSSLSKAHGLFVISRNSSATYKGKPVNVKRVSEELGVRYVLEGSVQKAGGELRISAQLIDALSGHHLWAARFDRPASDIFALQDEIARLVFVELQVQLTEGEHARVAARGTTNLEAWLLRAEAYFEFIKFEREANFRSRELYKAASEADENWGRPLGGIAFTHWMDARKGWSASRKESIRLGMENAERAVAISPNEPLGYMALGNLHMLIGDNTRGIELRRKAIELAPNNFVALAGLAMRLKQLGYEQDAIELFERAIRLSPRHPWWVPLGYGAALHLVGRKQEAVDWLQKANSQNAKRVTIHMRLAAVYVDLNRMDEARAAAKELLQLDSNFSISDYLEKGYSFQDPERNDWYKDLLMRAGLPK